jgi:hypothetical protein
VISGKKKVLNKSMSIESCGSISKLLEKTPLICPYVGKGKKRISSSIDNKLIQQEIIKNNKQSIDKKEMFKDKSFAGVISEKLPADKINNLNPLRPGLYRMIDIPNKFNSSSKVTQNRQFIESLQ